MLIVVVVAMAMKSMMALSTVTNPAMMMKGIVMSLILAMFMVMFMVVTQSTYLRTYVGDGAVTNDADACFDGNLDDVNGVDSDAGDGDGGRDDDDDGDIVGGLDAGDDDDDNDGVYGGAAGYLCG